MFEVNHPNFKSMLDILGKLKFSHIKEKGLERCERVTKSQRFTKTKKFLETIGTRESKTVIFSHFFLPPTNVVIENIQRHKDIQDKQVNK